ncbi:CPBP family intramembrane metalloprotease [Candidatus Daviesbacteria bacterium]|nr:CPBP family intramembrane metalloprotease [Candidatus Daviesbacteria bacterium]
MLTRLTKELRTRLLKVEPYWTLMGAPISQEVIFRFIPYELFYLPTGNFLEIGLLSSLLFALTHWYFGKLITIGTFLVGMIYWWAMVNLGLLAVIFVHSMVNVVILTFWKNKWLDK